MTLLISKMNAKLMVYSTQNFFLPFDQSIRYNIYVPTYQEKEALKSYLSMFGPSSNNMVKVSVKIIFQILEKILLFGLTIVSLLFSWEAIAKYKSKHTNLKRRHKEADKLPSIAICFKPLQDEYIYGEDFHINIYNSSREFRNDIKHSTNILQEGGNIKLGIKLVKIMTAFYGRCFKISHINNTVSNKVIMTVSIKFSEKMAFHNLPSAEVSLTSEENFRGIARAYWIKGKVLIYELFPNKLCSSKCLAHTIRDGTQKYEYCKPETPEWECSNVYLQKLRMAITENKTCQRSCKITEYDSEVIKLSFNHSNTIAFEYFIRPPHITIVLDEYLLFDVLGLVSSIGGSLGIFIGISIIAVITQCFSYLLIFYEKLSSRIAFPPYIEN